MEYCVVYDSSTISLELMLEDDSRDDGSADDRKHSESLPAAGRRLSC